MERIKTGEQGMSLAEVMVAFGILVIAILTMVGYTATIAKATSESKRQALASMYARTLLEQTRDDRASFDQAFTGAGLTKTQDEVLLSGEAETERNEVGNQSAAHFDLQARATALSDSIYSVVVTAEWVEDGRPREVVLETRCPRPDY